jgi:hypothetical protein
VEVLARGPPSGPGTPPRAGILYEPIQVTFMEGNSKLKGRCELVRTGAVSEVIGSLILVAIVVIGIAIVGVLLLASPTPSKVPAFHPIISNQSRTIYLYHKGGDPLWMGQFKILVDGGDQTGNFTFLSPGSDPWSVGETLTAASPSMPRRVVIILNQSGGGATILSVQDLVPGKTVAAPSDIMWYNYPSTGKCYWQYRKGITIDGSKVAGTLSSFPVLVNLPSDAQLAGTAQSSGNDILFTSADGTTKLDHEIESYTSSTGALVAWVEVPTLTAGTNTIIYMYYGNSTVASQQNPTGVWDANYLGVWHLNNSFASTTGSNNGVNTGSTNAAGKIGWARSFDGTGNQYITIAGQLGQPATVTLSAWASLVTADTKGAEVISVQNNVSLRMDATTSSYGTQGFFFNWTGKLWAPTQSGAYHAGTGWHYLTYVCNPGSSSEVLYLDGSAVKTTSWGEGIQYRNTGWDTFIGKHPSYTTYDFNGVIDEVRASNSVRSAQWIATEYANQASPSAFYALGSEESWWKC